MTSPSARTLALLRRRGFTACVVERWIAHRGIRVDAFHFADILAGRRRTLRGLGLGPARQVVGGQGRGRFWSSTINTGRR
jgi:hypothetical protein